MAFGVVNRAAQRIRRSLYEPLLRVLWRPGYRYLAAEPSTDKVTSPDFRSPDYQSGFYVRDPIFASAL
jgi:hypothetical protein